ncbi:MAG: acyl-ACP--UDP-N-acetylglucosamine O-acyltransferase [Chthoniobacteraceae bacterium]
MSGASIHPTAVIDPSAEIGAGCEIGPYCIVGAGVVLGENCWLQHHVSLTGPACFGGGNRFYAFCSIGQRTQDLKYEREPTHLVVGSENTFREFVTVNRGTAPGATTTIGNRGLFLAYCHIAHDCIVGDDVIFSNNGTLAGHVTVENHVVLGGFTAVHQFCRLGRHAMTGGCSKIVQDVPPFMLADGNPARVRGINKVGLERQGHPAETLRSLKEAYRLLYRSQLNVAQAVEQVRAELPDSPEIGHLIAFVTQSARGIIK